MSLCSAWPSRGTRSRRWRTCPPPGTTPDLTAAPREADMGKDRPERDPRSPFEDEGIPDLQDGTPQQQWAEDPQQAPLPGEDGFAAAADYGTTANEQREGEGLARRLAREQPEETGDPATRIRRPAVL